ncbi:MAG TPA: bifunctional 5,10-methylenetetrahydrofolate dehydrogenase/5,10-methenyltetrahydrofolate cyclohydrolase [Micromonosporaceae bacterium]|jgi:methylenetetrahydrofolate dehydrogenase (NADP+)/methenyltetrahydrofolate cyclohydrolase
MTARQIDGRALAADIVAEAAAIASTLPSPPTLAIVVATDDDATDWYVRNIQRTAARVGVTVRVERPTASTAEIGARLAALSADGGVHGVICQTPLPPGVDLADVAANIDPDKDVDGANPTSLGRLAAGRPAYAPATAAAVLEILEREQVPLEGAAVTVVGRSTVVGKPVALLLLARHATVTVCHSRTADLAAACRGADVLVVAAGRPGLVSTDAVKPGAVVIDVGTNPTPEGGLIGDVDPAVVAQAGALTPVPRGVGPVTTAVLLRHVVTAASLG